MPVTPGLGGVALIVAALTLCLVPALGLAQDAPAPATTPGQQQMAPAAKPPAGPQPAPLAPPGTRTKPTPLPPIDLAETVEGDVSSHRIAIESDFAGTHIILFGAVDNSRQRTPEQGLYDIVAVIRGPERTLVARRKDQVFGIWINQASAVFTDVPSYYTVLSTRPLEEIAKPDIFAQHHIGFYHLLFEKEKPAEIKNAQEAAAFRDAVVRIKQEDGLYREVPFAIGFISRSLFRGTVELPANVPIGLFDIKIYLFREGKLLNIYETKLDIAKAGFEKFVHNLAFNEPLIYGIAAVIIAIFAGLAASAVFRKS